MSRPYQLDTHRQTELLSEAASSHLPLAVTCSIDNEWRALKSSLLASSSPGEALVIEYPSDPRGVAPEIVAGQSLGLSFRRGHKKCAFNCLVLERCQFSVSGDKRVPALKLRWPDEMCELQRRLYYRTAVPPGSAVPVEVWRDRDAAGSGDRPPAGRGPMIDISAGGISLLLPREPNVRWQEGEPVTCAFAADRGEPPVRIPARLRHCEPIAEGQTRLGLQFVGLDASPEQRGALEKVIRLTVRLQRNGRRQENRRL